MQRLITRGCNLKVSEFKNSYFCQPLFEGKITITREENSYFCQPLFEGKITITREEATKRKLPE